MLWCRRHVAVSILMFLGLSLLSGIAGITTVAYFREVGFRNEIENALGEAKQAQTVAEVSQKRAVDAQKMLQSNKVKHHAYSRMSRT